MPPAIMKDCVDRGLWILQECFIGPVPLMILMLQVPALFPPRLTQVRDTLSRKRRPWKLPTQASPEQEAACEPAQGFFRVDTCQLYEKEPGGVMIAGKGPGGPLTAWLLRPLQIEEPVFQCRPPRRER